MPNHRAREWQLLRESAQAKPIVTVIGGSFPSATFAA
jgi:hypothetical protein